MNTLEILQNARAAILHEDWQFGNWNQCTCGHIYRAAVGNQYVTEGDVLDNMNHPALQEVAFALGWTGMKLPRGRIGCTAGDYISVFTQQVGKSTGSSGNPRRADGVEVLDQAIAKIEAEYEAARLDVLAQTKDVIDNVEVITDNVEVELVSV